MLTVFFPVKPNARYEPLPEAGATQERTLEAVGSMPLFGDAFTLHVLSLVCRRWDTEMISFRVRAFSLTISPQLLQQHLGLLEVSSVKAFGEPAVDGR
jgi:hypothetical protein